MGGNAHHAPRRDKISAPGGRHCPASHGYVLRRHPRGPGRGRTPTSPAPAEDPDPANHSGHSTGDVRSPGRSGCQGSQPNPAVVRDGHAGRDVMRFADRFRNEVDRDHADSERPGFYVEERPKAGPADLPHSRAYAERHRPPGVSEAVQGRPQLRYVPVGRSPYTSPPSPSPPPSPDGVRHGQSGEDATADRGTRWHCPEAVTSPDTALWIPAASSERGRAREKSGRRSSGAVPTLPTPDQRRPTPSPEAEQRTGASHQGKRPLFWIF